jgi:hypothetical protein
MIEKLQPPDRIRHTFYQAAAAADKQQRADLGRPEGLRTWRDTVVAQARSSDGKGRAGA